MLTVARWALSRIQDALNEQTSYTYDAAGRVSGVSFSADGGVTPGRTMTYDSDGRVASVNSSKYGTESYTYNADGLVTQKTEPNQGGVSAPATLMYDYYPNGWKQDVKVLSAPAPLTAGTQTLLSCTYRPDGLRVGETYGPTGQSFSWNYTPAGRFLSRSDPYTGQVLTGTNGATTVADSDSYDAQGRVAAHTYPNGGTQTSFTYDPEGDQLSYQITKPTYATGSTGIFATTDRISYTDRGEVVSVTANTANNPSVYGGTGEKIIRGYSCQLTGSTSICPAQVDSFTGALIKMTTNVAGCGTPTKSNSRTYTYDAGGRQTQAQAVEWDTTVCSSTTYAGPSSYDAENHTISSTCAGSACVSGTTTLGWGPNGHPILVDGNTLHWDGDLLLYVTNSSGNLINAKVDNTADITYGSLNYNGLTVHSRDYSGVAAVSYNQNGFSDWSAGTTVYNTKGYEVTSGDWSATSNWTDPNPIISTPRTDGYAVARDLRIQGTRLYSPTMQQWTTPDAYAGEVHDPMSQKPYMWNRDNPVAYEDPSGYCAEDACVGEGAAAALLWVGLGAIAAAASATHHDDIANVARDAQHAVSSTVASAANAIANAFRGNTLPAQGPPNGAARRGDSVQYYDKDGFRTKRVDLTGKSHDGVPTPHVEDYEKPNVAPDGTKYPGNSKGVRPAASQEVKDAEGRPQGSSGGSGQSSP